MEVTPDMSELVGAIIGDGNIYDHGGRPCWVEITGNADTDLDYFQNVLSNIIRTELFYNPRIFFRKDSTVHLRIFSKGFVSYLKGLGIPAGYGKGYNVLIPPLLTSDWQITKRCIRGIMDTDGCFSLDKRKAYRTPYPRVVLHMHNRALVLQIHALFVSHGFAPTFSEQMTVHGEMDYVYLSGKEQVSKYLREIGFSNKRHINRIGKIYPELVELNLSMPR